jgi:DNA-binding CsgD family transcriptional regulator
VAGSVVDLITGASDEKAAMYTTLLGDDGTIVWTSHSPGPPIADVIGTKIWKWAPHGELNRWREFLSAAILDGHSGPHLTRYAEDKYVVETTRVSNVAVVARWKPHCPAILSAQETRVLRLICDDLRSSQIAEQLGVTVNTVETYRARLKAKVGVDGTAGLVRWAVRVGLVSA